MMSPQRAGSRSIAAGTAKFGSNSIELQCGARLSTSSRLAAVTSEDSTCSRVMPLACAMASNSGGRWSSATMRKWPSASARRAMPRFFPIVLIVRPHEGKTVIDGRNSGAAALMGAFQRGGRSREGHGILHLEARADRKDIGAVEDVTGARRVDDGNG